MGLGVAESQIKRSIGGLSPSFLQWGHIGPLPAAARQWPPPTTSRQQVGHWATASGTWNKKSVLINHSMDFVENRVDAVNL